MSIGKSKDWIQELYVKEMSEKSNVYFYLENGKKVMTGKYHRDRGYCCGSGCRHCPYVPKGQKGSTNLG